MGCLIAIVALFVPRLTIVGLWIFTGFIGTAFGGALWPILGLLFAPFTLLAAGVGLNAHGSIEGWYSALVVLAALIDASALSGSGKAAGDLHRGDG